MQAHDTLLWAKLGCPLQNCQWVCSAKLVPTFAAPASASAVPAAAPTITMAAATTPGCAVIFPCVPPVSCVSAVPHACVLLVTPVTCAAAVSLIRPLCMLAVAAASVASSVIILPLTLAAWPLTIVTPWWGPRRAKGCCWMAAMLSLRLWALASAPVSAPAPVFASAPAAFSMLHTAIRRGKARCWAGCCKASA